MAEIGFVGLGNMGRPMARRLLDAGHAVRGFDVAAPAREAAGAAGLPLAGDMRGAAEGAAAVFTMLPAGRRRARGLLRGRRAAGGGGPRYAARRLLHHRSRNRASRSRRGIRRGVRHAGRAGFRRGRRGRGGHAHLHGRGRRGCRGARRTADGDDGSQHRPRRRARQRPGRQDVQQHGPRRLDDRGVGGLYPRRAGRARCPDPVRYRLHRVGPVLVAHQLLPGPGPGAVLARQPRLPGRFSPRR